MSKAVMWVRRYGTLEAVVFDSLDEAIRQAIRDEPLEQDQLELIEHGGEQVTQNHPTYRTMKEEWDRANRMRGEVHDPTTHVLQARHPDGTWVDVLRLTDPVPPTRSSASLWAQYIDALGGERVRIAPVDG